MHRRLSSVPAFVAFVLALATAASLVSASPVPTTSHDKNEQVHLSPETENWKALLRTQRTDSMFHHFIHLYRCGTIAACYIKCGHHLPDHYEKFQDCTSNCLAPYEIRYPYEQPDMNSTVWPPVWNKTHHNGSLLHLSCK